MDGLTPRGSASYRTTYMVLNVLLHRLQRGLILRYHM